MYLFIRFCLILVAFRFFIFVLPRYSEKKIYRNAASRIKIDQ